MLQISKEEAEYIRNHFSESFITICSKRKHGGKGCRASGKTYYCPESNKYINMLEKYRESHDKV